MAKEVFCVVGFFPSLLVEKNVPCSSPEEVKAFFCHTVVCTMRDHQALLFVQGVAGCATLRLNLRENL